MSSILIKDMFNLEQTIAKELFETYDYPWEILPHIGDYIKELGGFEKFAEWGLYKRIRTKT